MRSLLVTIYLAEPSQITLMATGQWGAHILEDHPLQQLHIIGLMVTTYVTAP